MSNRRSSSPLSSIFGIALLLLATLCCGDACERDTKISVEGGNPPTFKLSGNGNLVFLAVTDDSPNKVEKRSGEILWKIIPESGKSQIGQLPPITYGQLPSGFNQEIPGVGAPPPLIAERPYEVAAPTSNAHGDWIFFIIRDGAAAKVGDASRRLSCTLHRGRAMLGVGPLKVLGNEVAVSVPCAAAEPPHIFVGPSSVIGTAR